MYLVTGSAEATHFCLVGRHICYVCRGNLHTNYLLRDGCGGWHWQNV